MQSGNESLKRHLIVGPTIERPPILGLTHAAPLLLDSLCVPLKVIQERAGHALTGSFTLDVYGGKPEWVGNVEAARKAGLAIEQSVAKVQEPEPSVGLTAVKEERLPMPKSEAFLNQ